MARISLGNFGNSTPGRAPQVSQPAGAFGAGAAAALEAGGRVATNIGLDMVAAETRMANEEMQRQKAQSDAVERAQEGAALHETQDKLRDLHDEIGNQVLTGQLPRDVAEQTFGERSKQVIDEALPRFRDSSKPLVAPRLQADTATMGNSVRRIVEKRGKQEVTTAVGKSLEYFERLYLTDPVAAQKGAEGTLAAMGPWSDMSPEQVAKAGQGWKERTQFNAALRLVNDGRRDNATLDKVAKSLDDPRFADLDPSRRGQLLTTIEAYRVSNAQKAEADARRRQADEERAYKRAESQFNAAQSIITLGKNLRPEYVAEVTAAVAGTPFEGALREVLQQGPERGAFALRPIAEQRAALQSMRQELNKATDPESEKQYAAMVKITNEAEKSFHDDAMTAGASYGLYDIQPLNMGDLNGIVSGLAVRTQQAGIAERQLGKPVSPLTAQEAERVGEILALLPPSDRSKYVATMAQAVGPKSASALAAQIDKKDRALGLAFAMAGSATTNGRFTSELVLKGAQAKKDGTSTKGEKQPDVKVASWKATASAELADVFPTQTATDAYRDASELIMHGMAAEQGGRLSQDDMRRAVELAIGGKLVEHNGRKIALPAGVDTDMLDKRLKSVTADELAPYGKTVRAGGVEIPTEEFVKTLPGAELIYAGPGRYSVIVSGRPVVGANRKRVVIGVTQ